MLSRPLGCLTVVAFLSTPALAQNVTTSQGVSITIRGIVNATFFAQDATFGIGNGQKANYVTAERNRWVHSGDVRNSRLTVALAGPEVSRGWRANATAELDFFGAFASAGGAFGNQQPQPRLRVAYADLTNGRTTLRIGQDWDLLLGNIPVSTSHIAFPLGHGSGGFVGWRFMQVRLMKTLSRPGAAATTRFQVAMLSGSWNNSTGLDAGFNAGEAGAPQFEGRFDYSTAKWSGYLVAHTDTKATPGEDLNSYMVELGANTTRGDLSLQGNAWIGKGMAHHIAQIVQFGDIKGWGAWAQVGYTLNPKWSVWGFYGTDRPDSTDLATLPLAGVTEANGTTTIAVAARRFSSWTFAPMVRYKPAGPYSLGLEWLHNEVKLGSGNILAGNQVLLSTRFDF
jgi:hypothetical protein